MDFEFDARVGWFHGDVRELLKKYPVDFFLAPFGMEDNAKYAAIMREGHESYALMVSNPDRGMDYNLMITVCGPRKKRAVEIMTEVTKALGIETRPAPGCVLRMSGDVVDTMEKSGN